MVVTTKLNNGHSVLGRFANGQVKAFTYANRAQADRKAEEVGGDVRRFVGRPFYIVMDLIEGGVEGTPNTRRATTLGRCAYAGGAACKPTLDPVLMATHVGRSVGDARTALEFDAWKDGWIRASLAESAKRRRRRPAECS